MLRQQTSDAERRVSVGEGLIEVANAMMHLRNAMAGAFYSILVGVAPHNPRPDDAKVLATAIAAIARDEPL